MFTSAEAAAARLAERYSGPTYELDKGNAGKFTYVPWHINVRLLDEIFGAFGWTMSQPAISISDGLVHVALSITVRVAGEDGVIEKTVGGVGSAALRDDNSAKSAMSDALSKAVKFLGDAFAFYLSEEKKPQQQSGGGYNRSNGNGNGYQQRPATGGGGAGGATDAQKWRLKKMGVDEAEIAKLSKQEASAMIDELSNAA